MKKLLILLIISISFSVNAADSYRLDMDWVQDNLDNKDFMSDSNCSYSALLLTKFGDEFFQTTGLFIDDINENIQAARNLGINAIHFKSIEKLKIEMNNMGLNI